MREELSFKELAPAFKHEGRTFALYRRGTSMRVALEFLPILGRWELARLNIVNDRGTIVSTFDPIMEIEGTSDKPPIDLALATLTLMGY